MHSLRLAEGRGRSANSRKAVQKLLVRTETGNWADLFLNIALLPCNGTVAAPPPPPPPPSDDMFGGMPYGTTNYGGVLRWVITSIYQSGN